MTDLLAKTTALLSRLIAAGGGEEGSRAAQEVAASLLEPLGFQVERFEEGGIRHLWAATPGVLPLVVFAGHSDVVPPGDLARWSSPPFEPTLRGEFLYGRGAVDMRGGLAASLVAIEEFLKERADRSSLPCRLGFLVAGDEETSALGTELLLAKLLGRGEVFRAAIVAEPSSEEQVGDSVKVGRRGSVTATITFQGLQGHSAYPEKATNPIHAALPALQRVRDIELDEGDDHWPRSTLQITNISAGTGATNVIPGVLEAKANIRYSPRLTRDEIVRRVEAAVALSGVPVQVRWSRGCDPFLTPDGPLRRAVSEAIADVTAAPPRFASGGGTSDARFFAAHGIDVVELGPVGPTMHQVDERVEQANLPILVGIFVRILERLTS